MYYEEKLVGACIFARPFSTSLQKMICGDEESENVLELTRLYVDDCMPKNTESWFISRCLKQLNENIIVSFADTAMNHTGIIYQALNFIYTGLTDPKKNFKLKNVDKHALTLASKYTAQEMRDLYGEDFYYENRSRKHRYIYIKGKRKKELMKKFKLFSLPYPK